MPSIDQEALLSVSNGISALTRELFGRGPERTRAYTVEDNLFVVMQAGFTTIERTYLEDGQEGFVRDMRMGIQRLAAERYRGVVERATGRKVHDYMSQILIPSETIVEIFLLEEG